MSQAEQWAVVYHCPEYEVSTYGRVRTKLTFSRSRKLADEYHVLKPVMIRGYLTVKLYNYVTRISGEKRIKKIQQNQMIHRLVYRMHVLRSDLIECPYLEHIDGNKQNNHVDNLRPKRKTAYVYALSHETT